jgi:gamma-polyglutamate synthase
MRRVTDQEILTGLSEVEQQLFSPLLRRAVQEQKSWLTEQVQHAGRDPKTRWIEFLKFRIDGEMQALENLRVLYARFDRALKACRDLEDQKQLMLNFARDLGATPSELKKDEKAFARWFGADALQDRYTRRHAAHEQYVAFLLGRLGALAGCAGRDFRTRTEQLAFWNRLQLEPLVKPLLAHDGDARLNLAAFKCLTTVLSALDPEIQEGAVDDTTLQFIYRSALQHQQEVWIQCAALELLVTLSWSSFQRALRQRLLQPGSGDDLFVRRRAVELLAQHFPRVEEAPELILAALSDPSAFVRQALPKVVIQAPVSQAEPWLRKLVIEDPSPQVRAATWLEWPELLGRADWRDVALGLFGAVGCQETNEFALRVMCRVAEQGTEALVRRQDKFLALWHSVAAGLMVHLRCEAGSLKVRRWASRSAEFIWSETHPAARTLRRQFTELVRSIPRGGSRRIPEAWTRGVEPELLGRIWSIVCRNDYDVQLKSTWRGYKVIRGHVFGFRWWRWWHEFRHPSPDKRQAFSHTIGRLFDGEIHAPSGIMAELAQTKVPGEPLQIAEEAGWRPYLPLVDELTSAVELGRKPKPVRIFTSEGVTNIEPPRGWRRWRALWRLTWRFREYAEKRNWLESMQESPAAYARGLRELGFGIRFDAYADEAGQPLPADPMVERFFVPTIVWPSLLVEQWDRFHSYSVSLYQNSVLELAVFVLIFGALFFGCHLFFNLRMKFWRRRIPLVIGGWGTRGKSGTERIKAALFNALGTGVVSKTTGCEAMFLQAYPFGPMKEMFLFRPYDKATIWEQVNVVRLAGRFKTEVMLWECMGLTPAYVKILQRSWMRDQFATITNTYPDHEDLQGPAGINIPEVIGCFIPEKSTLVTSEEQMLPILTSEAERQKTRLYPVTWLEAGLIPNDILQRFPYEEHPCNIALVLGLAERLGIDRTFALKEMADRVVPDLGVLKTYPVATIRTRRLEFTNGMSANERFGTISNWTRTGFDRQDYLKEPTVWLTTVVNNRADRIPRSQVFARVLVNDLAADRHVLIGGNLAGLQGYIKEAWSEKAPTLSLWQDAAQPSAEHGLKVLEQQAQQMRLPIRPELIQTHLRTMLAAQPEITNVDELVACWERPEDLKSRLAPLELAEMAAEILDCLEYEVRIYREYTAFAEEVRRVRADQGAALDQRFRELLQRWFESKLIVVEDYFASGNQIIDLIARRTPPGFLNRVMGIQNIKGTGLDFVYRWQAWMACHKAAQPLCAEKPRLTPQALAPLTDFKDYGVLCEEFVRGAIQRVKNLDLPQPVAVLEELDRIQACLDSAIEQVRQKMKSTGGHQGGWWTTVLTRIEEFLDAGDAVCRRGQADRIYEDLLAERISRDRAVVELQELTQRQKGGWLVKKLQGRFKLRKAAPPQPKPELQPAKPVVKANPGQQASPAPRGSQAPGEPAPVRTQDPNRGQEPTDAVRAENTSEIEELVEDR